MSIENSNVKNGFDEETNQTDRDNPLRIYGSINVGGSLYDGQSLLSSATVSIVDAVSTLTKSGIFLIDGGTGISFITLNSLKSGSYARLKLRTLTSGTVVVKTPAGVTFDGTNNTATFDAIDEELEIGYLSSTQWVVIYVNGVPLTST